MENIYNIVSRWYWLRLHLTNDLKYWMQKLNLSITFTRHTLHVPGMVFILQIFLMQIWIENRIFLETLLTWDTIVDLMYRTIFMNLKSVAGTKILHMQYTLYVLFYVRRHFGFYKFFWKISLQRMALYRIKCVFLQKCCINVCFFEKNIQTFNQIWLVFFYFGTCRMIRIYFVPTWNSNVECFECVSTQIKPSFLILNRLTTKQKIKMYSHIFFPWGCCGRMTIVINLFGS